MSKRYAKFYVMTREEKEESLKSLRLEIKANKSLPFRKGANQIVFGDGNPTADIFILGESPGYHEDRIGKPFVGQSGRALELLLKKVGLSRREVYLSTIIRYRPPLNQKVLLYQFAEFQPYIDREIEIVKPKIIVTLGRSPMEKFIQGEKISGIHGKPRSIIWHELELVIVPMFNPAAAIKTASVMRQLEQDFLILKDEVAKLEVKRQEELERKRLEDEERRKPQQVGLF